MTVGQSSFPGQPHGGCSHELCEWRSQPMGGGWPARSSIAVVARKERLTPAVAQVSEANVAARCVGVASAARLFEAVVGEKRRSSFGLRILPSRSRCFASPASAGSERRRRAPGGAPEDEFSQSAVRQVEQLRPTGPRATATPGPGAGYFGCSARESRAPSGRNRTR